jgi:hypothetical protein
MNYWAVFSIVLFGYLVYSNRLNNEMNDIKSILVVVYETVEKKFVEIINEINLLKSDMFMMLNYLQNNTLRTWDAITKNNIKITNLDDKVNALLAKSGVVNNVLNVQ